MSGTPSPAKTSPNYYRYNLLVVVVGVGIAYILRSGHPIIADWSRSLATLRDAYALCTPGGDNIYTVDVHSSNVQCIVIYDTKIVDLGSVQEVAQRWKTLDLTGAIPKFARPSLSVKYTAQDAVVLPGLSDAHAHILEYGASRILPLEGTKTIQDTVTRVRNYILSNPHVHNDTEKFILGGGWDHTVWPTTGWPSAADLESDPVLKGRPIVLQSKDCHALWVSDKVIQLSLPFPDHVEGGVIVRDKDGFPTGLLLDNAQELVNQPELTETDLMERFNVTVKHAQSYGLTSIHDAGLDPISLKFFTKQAEENTLPIRIYGMTFFDENGEYWGNKSKPVHLPVGGRLAARSVKIFADGALRTGGAALYEPYHDNPSTRGVMRISAEVLHHWIPLFLRDGWQVNVHAIGDRANGIVIDAFEKVLKGVDVGISRPRLEHAQIITKEDVLRLSKLGVIASVQPTHAISDMWFAQDRLGPERVKNLYAFRTIIDSGARIALGSDAPVETLNPLSGFYAAITRLSPEGKSPHGPEGWFPEQRLSRLEALRGMTIDPAYASFTETILGSLEVGKIADYVVLSRDIMTIPVTEILMTKVLATAIDGIPVYGQI